MTASERSYRQICHMIATGELQPGQRVSQVMLAKRFNCSTVPVVEAMRRLESEGLLVKQGRKMAKVRMLSLEDMEGIYLVREGLESIAARRCAQRISDKQIERLRELVGQFETACSRMEYETFSRVDMEIHRTIVESADCPLLAEELSRLFLIEKTAAAVKLLRFPIQHRHSHRAILEAIADHDGDAAEYLMRKHIQNGYQELVEMTKAAKAG